MTLQQKKNCSNEDLIIFCRLPGGFQETMRELGLAGHLQYLGPETGIWYDVPCTKQLCLGLVYRVKPDAPVERGYRYESVFVGSLSLFEVFVPKTAQSTNLAYVIGHVNFAGVVYSKDGTETLRPHLSAEFGEPVRVRFFTENE